MQALIHQVTVQENGQVPVPPLAGLAGTTVKVILLLPEEEEDFSDLTMLSMSSMDWWDNELDDETWNNA